MSQRVHRGHRSTDKSNSSGSRAPNGVELAPNAAVMCDVDVEAADCRAALLPVVTAANDVPTASVMVHGVPLGGTVGGKLDASATIALGGNSPPTARRAPLQSLNRRATIQQSSDRSAGVSTGLSRCRGTSTSSAGASAWKLKYQDFLPGPGTAAATAKQSMNDGAAIGREQSESFQ